MAILRMPPDIVVRGAGIWNSRAPFHQYLAEYKRLNGNYALAVLAALKVQRDLTGAAAPALRTYFNPRKTARRISNARELRAWKAYKKALGRDAGTGEFEAPAVTDVLEDLEGVVASVRAATLVRQVALFESYLQCWTLNYLLSRLEEGALWTNEERYLATKLSPVHSTEPEPSAAFILRCLPGLQNFLSKVPTFFTDRATGKPLDRPQPPELNALAVVRLWVAVRNQVVHRNGWISTRFATKHSPTWQLLFGGLKHIPALQAARPLLLYHEIVNSAALNLYRTSLALSDELERCSMGRRGHPWAPSPRPFPQPAGRSPAPEQLVLEGDHQLSWRWATDDPFRRSFVDSNQP